LPCSCAHFFALAVVVRTGTGTGTGTTCERSLALGASRCMNSSGSMRMWVALSFHCVLSLSITCSLRFMLKRSLLISGRVM
jgi:hypothetical protein